jgi:hypothetical protein
MARANRSRPLLIANAADATRTPILKEADEPS